MTRSSRIVTGALALLVVTGLSHCAHHGAYTSGLNTVVVDAAGNARPADVYLSLSNGDTVLWAAFQAGHTLKITFHHELFPKPSNGEPPFVGANGADLVLTSTTGVIYSGPINSKLKAVFDANPTLQLPYPYDQQIDGGTKDGRIIIMK